MADFKARWVGGSIVADSFSKKRWRELLAQRKRGRQAAEQEDEDIPLLLLLGAHNGSPFSSLAATSGAPSFLISSGISIKCFCKWLSELKWSCYSNAATKAVWVARGRTTTTMCSTATDLLAALCGCMLRRKNAPGFGRSLPASRKTRQIAVTLRAVSKRWRISPQGGIA